MIFECGGQCSYSMSHSTLSPNGFAPILAIFYSVFHTTEGSKVLCQVPEGAISLSKPDINGNNNSHSSSALSEPLFPFHCIKNYVIPKPALCNRLVSIKINEYRVMGYPVLINGEGYERNSFVFNFAFVFHARAEFAAYETSIRRLAKMFSALEEQSRYLSNAAASLQTISNIIEQIYQDLNNFSECMIPVDESNSVNFKLFPLIPAPPEIESHHVPISTVQLDALKDENWDPTMEKIVPYINGINSVRRIADLADADYMLTKQCVQHLIHYQCIVIVDLFQFSNVYAPTSDLVYFLRDPNMFAEFQAYVYKFSSSLNLSHSHSHTHSQRTSLSTATTSQNLRVNNGASTSYPYSRSGNHSLDSPSHSHSHSSLMSNSFGSHGGTSGPPTIMMGTSRVPMCSMITCFNLYRSLHQGQTVHDWYQENRKVLGNIDVRRFISFGVIKGLIYRLHSYPIYEPMSRMQRMQHGRRQSHLDPKRPNFAADAEIDNLIKNIINRPKHFDAICTDLRQPKWQVEKALQKTGDWTVISC